LTKVIIGVGTDLCDIRRIEKTLKKFGTRFTSRLFSVAERSKAQQNPNPAATYAKYFAGKEAFAKSLGTGFREGVFWQSIEVKSLKSGQPYIEVSGGARAKLESLLPANSTFDIKISLTDEYPLAHAIVIICSINLL